LRSWTLSTLLCFRTRLIWLLQIPLNAQGRKRILRSLLKELPPKKRLLFHAQPRWDIILMLL
jgi:hypothetical protein